MGVHRDQIDWTPALVDRLTALWRQGLSSVEIARELGITKNAALGKAHRLMLAPRPRPAPLVSRRYDTPKPSRASPPCSWPMGYPGDPRFRFCGAPALDGKPYCAQHAALAYVPAPKARETAP